MLKTDFTFIDLFAGIGGFHLAMSDIGGSCVFACEIDENARKTYKYNFEKHNPNLFQQGLFARDILEVPASNIPDADVLCAGFPCQPFSQAGYKRGFDETHQSRGNMFFVICEILKAKRPKALFLENVRHLLAHDNGRTFQIILETLDALDYDVYYKIVKASDYGLPQHRPRVFIIGFDRALQKPNFYFPPKKPLRYTMSDIFNGDCKKDIGFTLRVGGRGSSIDDRRNWEFYRVNGEVKRIEIAEGKKMMGLPDNFHFPVGKIAAMKQMGNGVAVDAVREVARAMIAHLNDDVSEANTQHLPLFELYQYANA